MKKTKDWSKNHEAALMEAIQEAVDFDTPRMIDAVFTGDSLAYYMKKKKRRARRIA